MYLKRDCVKREPNEFKDKNIGKSWYFYETYENYECTEIRTKKERVEFIDKDYVDGQCIKDDF